MKILERIARVCSILGGLIMVALMIMTCYSLIGRNFLDRPLIGDFELTAIGCGVAIALFMPICQLHRENIIVDFFTAKMSEGVNDGLDRFGFLLMALIYGVVSWRAFVGARSAYEGMGASMLLGFPDWIVYTGIAVPMLIAGIVALTQLVSKHKQEVAA